MGVMDAPATGSVWGELVDELPLGVLLIDSDGVVQAGNERAAELLGCTVAQLRTGERPDNWWVRDEGGAALPATADTVGQVLRARASLAIPMVVGIGDEPPVRLWVSYHPIGQQRVLVALRPVHTDMGTAHSMLDPLTGLPNRVLLTDRLDQALIRARTHGTLVSLILLDIRRMGAINAEFGFRRGDDLLVFVAGRLRGGLRADHTVARYSGNRFAVIAEHPTGTGRPIAAQATELLGRSAKLGSERLRPSARACWLTTDGNIPAHRLLARLETRLAGDTDFPQPRPAE
jgi:GGDEF domain-containing protein